MSTILIVWRLLFYNIWFKIKNRRIIFRIINIVLLRWVPSVLFPFALAPMVGWRCSMAIAPSRHSPSSTSVRTPATDQFASSSIRCLRLSRWLLMAPPPPLRLSPPLLLPPVLMTTRPPPTHRYVRYYGVPQHPAVVCQVHVFLLTINRQMVWMTRIVCTTKLWSKL